MSLFAEPEAVSPPAGAARVGAELMAARQRLGWQLPDVSSSLRIRLPYLEAIEEGRLSALPGNAYAVGFVRTYAGSLGLDPDEVARRFRAEAREVNEKTALAFPAPVPQRGVPAGAVILVGLLIAAGAYVGWYRYSGNEARVQQAVTAPPERLAAMAPQPQTQSPQVASILPSSPLAGSPLPNSPLAGSPHAAATLGAMAGPGPAQTLPPAPAALPVPTPVPVAIAPPVMQAAPPPVPTRFQIKSKTGGFVLVKERLGKTLLRRVLQAGETWPIPEEPDLLLTTGNAGAVQLVVDGKPGPALGGIGAVLNDVALDPLLARAGRAASTSGRRVR